MTDDSIGIDISKDKLDCHRLSDGAFEQLPNTRSGFQKLRRWVGPDLPARVVFEPIRLRPIHPNHIWAIDFVHDKLSNGRLYKMLTVLDEYTREAFCVAVGPKMNANDVLDVLLRLLMKHGKPKNIRSDNGPEFIAAQLQNWLKRVSIKPMQINPASPWGNGYNERFNGTLRREVANAEWYHTTKQAQVAINVWLRHYNKIRPRHALKMRPPVPETLSKKAQTNVAETGG